MLPFKKKKDLGIKNEFTWNFHIKTLSCLRITSQRSKSLAQSFSCDPNLRYTVYGTCSADTRAFSTVGCGWHIRKERFQMPVLLAYKSFLHLALLRRRTSPRGDSNSKQDPRCVPVVSKWAAPLPDPQRRRQPCHPVSERKPHKGVCCVSQTTLLNY